MIDCLELFSYLLVGNYTYGIQLLPSSGVRLPVIRNMISIIHQRPAPPSVSNFPTAAPTCPRQNLSIPASPSKIEYSKVVKK